MRPFYRKDLFRDDIIKVMPKELLVKIDQGDKKLSLLRMEKGQSMTLNSEEFEVGLIILSGVATVEAGTFEAKNKGERKDVFSGKPTAIYIPKQTEYTIRATGYGLLEIAICMAKTNSLGEPFVVEQNQVNKCQKGVFNWKRDVNEIFIPGQTEGTCGLIIGETYGCPGSWAIYPYKDVKEDTIMLFKLSLNQGKKVQVMGKEDSSSEYYVMNDTTLRINGDYLPIAKTDDCQVYCLWFKTMQL